MRISFAQSLSYLHDRLRLPSLNSEEQFHQRLLQLIAANSSEGEHWQQEKKPTPFRFEFPFIDYEAGTFSLPHPLREGTLTVSRRADFYTAELTFVAMHANYFTHFSSALAHSFGRRWHPTHPDGRGYIFTNTHEPLASIGLPSRPLHSSHNSHRIITLGTSGAQPRLFTADKGEFMHSLTELEGYGNTFLEAFYDHHELSPLDVVLHIGC